MALCKRPIDSFSPRVTRKHRIVTRPMLGSTTIAFLLIGIAFLYFRMQSLGIAVTFCGIAWTILFFISKPKASYQKRK